LIPYGKHTTTWLDAYRVARQVKSDSLTQGKKIEEFEKAIASYVGAEFAIAVSSATAGLHLAMLALKLPADKKVVTSPISFVATANAIQYADLEPLFIDVMETTGNISADIYSDLCRKDSNIGAVIPVHFSGQSCDMEKIYSTSKKNGIRIIEDAAHALGGSYSSGMKIGNCKYSDMTVFSFHAVKSITTGEGGVITTNNPDLYNELLKLRSHGITKLSSNFANNLLAFSNKEVNTWYYEMQNLGFHYRITDIQAALGLSQMKKIHRFMKNRIAGAKYYDLMLQNSNLIKPLSVESRNLSGNHIYPVLIDFTKISINRNQLMKEMKLRGIGTQVHYQPIPLQPFYNSKGFDMNSLPNALAYYNKTLTLPLHPKLKRRQQKRIIKEIQNLVTANLIC
jgi:UDP-4-amino-4,6-dideoxy-N-acetyl-beta-L-altrosamine transaminase